MNSNIFDKLSFLALFLVVVLLPLFALPFTNIPVEASKGLLLVLGLAISIVFWAIAKFLDGNIILPKSWIILSGAGISLIFLLSSLLSSTPQVSLFGTMFDVGSFWFIFAAFVLMLMSSIIFKNTKQAKIFLLGTILSSALVLIFQTVHLFFPETLSLGILSGKTGNVLGSWNALGLFAGFSALMFLLVIEFFPISKFEKVFLQILILLSMFVIASVNFTLVWILLGISGLIIFVYKVSITLQRSEGEQAEKKPFPTISFVVVMISLLFFISGQFIGSFIPDRLQISNTEVGPSISATFAVTKGVLLKHPLLGIGPNRFSEAWSLYKPAVINNTQFWDVSFDSSFGALPTLLSTTGGLGILSWLVFLVLFLIAGVKSVFSSIKNGANWEMMAFFVLSLYLIIASFFYATGVVIFLLAFAFMGVFAGLAVSNSGKELSISFLNDHRKSFFSILVLILLIITSITASFKFTERFVSISYFGKALSAQTIPLAQENIGKALSLYSNDLYLRTYSQIYLLELNSIAAKGSNLSDEEKANLQTSFDQVVKSAQLAVSYNPSNYLNFQLLGSVYQAVGALGTKDAYSQAVLAYQNASNLNPLNPGLKIAIANSLYADGKGEEALIYAKEALALMPNNKDIIEYVNSIKNKLSAPAVEPAPDKPKQ